MPTYDMACDACKHTWERVCSIAVRDRHVNCPQCGSPKTKRVFTTAPALPWTPVAAESGRNHYREPLREGC